MSRLLLIAALALSGCTKPPPKDGRELVASCVYGDIYAVKGRLYRASGFGLEPVAQGVPIENICTPPN